ncbi:MFS transporter [Spirillospora sp. NPDC047279]|uniref:MFS transporter n=1 Tax=Spirillospora sp. NPDC047279 TaxID=3155478 RepID=UPI0033E7D4FC
MADGGGVFYGWRIVAGLAVSQTVGFGVLYYSFAVVLTPMRHDLGISTTQATGALTLALLVTAVAAVPVGRRLDRHGGRGLMTLGSAAATALVAAWAGVGSLAELYLVFAGIGLVSAMVLYEPAFAVIVVWFRRRRASALLAITVVAGFASTIFMPLTGWLTDAYGWRTALLVLAAILGAVTIPLHALVRAHPSDLGLRPDGDPPPDPEPPGSARPVRERPERKRPGPERPDHEPAGREGRAEVRADRAEVSRVALRDPVFWALVVAFVAHTGAVAVIGVHLVAYLVDLGHPAAFAAAVAGLLGVLSVTGRLATSAAQRRFAVTTVVAVVFALQGVAAFVLPATGDTRAGAVACVLVFGLGFGVATIARPALLADRYGTAAFGTISGFLTFPLTVAKAVAPLAAAFLLAATGGYTPVMACTGAACALAAAALLAAGRRRRDRLPDVAVRPETGSLSSER